MKNKKTEATLSRPEGDRLIDAPQVFINIPEFIRQIKQESAWQRNDRNAITVFKTEEVTIVLVCLHPEAVLKENVIDGTITLQVIEGIIRVTTPGNEREMSPNQIMAFHRMIDHSIMAVTESVLLLTNHSVEQ